MRVSVIGADGAIGSALALALRMGNHEVVGTTRRPNHANLPEKMLLDLSLEMPASLPQADIAVICAAMSRFAECREQPALAHRVNVEGPMQIAERQLSQGGRVLLLSTSAVFDCRKPLRKADDARSPRSVYGRLKAEAEAGLAKMGQGTAVLRLTKVLHPETGILRDWIAALAAGQTVTAFNDHGLCPLPLDTVIAAIVSVIESGEDGIFQVSGADDISYVDAACHLAKRLGVDARRVVSVPAATAGLASDEITPYTSLDSGRLNTMTGFMPPRAIDVIDTVYGSALAQARRTVSAH